MSIIQVDNLSFSYDGNTGNDLIFDDVSFRMDSDWKLGLIGRNGRGKTTFFNLLMNKLSYKGIISSSVAFDLYPMDKLDESGLVSEIVLTLSGCEEWELRREMNLIALSEDVLYRAYHTLSSGEQTKVQIIILFLKKNNFLLFDEPTNHLDVHGREQLIRYLGRKKGFIMISHDRDFLDRTVDHILSINRSNIEVVKGNYTLWKENRDRQDEFELRENEKIEKALKKLENARGQTKNWSDKVEASKWGDDSADSGYIGHKSAKMMKRSKSLENRMSKQIEAQRELLKNVEEAEPLKMFPLQFHSDPLIRCDHLCLSYSGIEVFDNINFSVSRGERVRLSGGNGSGKSSVIKAIISQAKTGKLPPEFSGELALRKGLAVSYIPQDLTFLKGSLNDFINENRLDEPLFKAVLRKLDFERIQFEKDMGIYSAGQKQKVFLAKSLTQPAHLFIWDEPLNFVDIYSRVQIEAVILTFNPTMVFVEHDVTFGETIMTKEIKF